MMANDLADLYVSCRAGESGGEIAEACRQWLAYLGWDGRVLEGPPPPAEMPPLEGAYLGLRFDPSPTSSLLADAVRAAGGQGRTVCLPYYDALLAAWRWSSTDRDFPHRGITLHTLGDTSVRLAGSYFALLPWHPCPTSLFFGAIQEFSELILRQGWYGKGHHAWILERAEFARRERTRTGTALCGPLPLESAPVGSIVAVVLSALRPRVVPGAFPDLASARAAVEASSEDDILLLARLVEAVRLPD